MDNRVKHSLETRIEAARLFDAGFGFRAVARQLGVGLSTSRSWHDRHRQAGLLGLVPVSSQRKYSPELKIAAVEEFLAGVTTAEVISKYEIHQRSQLNKWVAIYRTDGPEGLQPKKAGRPVKQDRPETMEEELQRLRMENAVLKKLAALMNEDDPRMWQKPTSSRH